MSNPPPPYNPYYNQGVPPNPPGWQVPPQPQPGAPGAYGYPAPFVYPPGRMEGEAYQQAQPMDQHGGYGAARDEEVGGQPKTSGILFSDKSIRQGFVRKVFLILTGQLLVVTAFVALFTFNKGLQSFIVRNSWLYYLSFAVFFITYLMIGCCPGFRRRFPGNMICLVLLTLAMAYMTATIAGFYSNTTVFLAALCCMLSCGAIVTFSMQTKYDFTACMGVMFIAGIVLMLFGFVAIIFTLVLHNPIIYVVYASLATLLFMSYLAIDVQMVMGGKQYEISPEDYVFAATQLFVDIIYIFWYLLQIIGFINK